MIEVSWGALGAIVLVLLGAVFAVVTAVLAKLSGDEVSGWLPVWSNRFLDSAASVVAPEYRDRYREEWKAELAAFRDRRLSGIRFAWRLRRRARSVNAALAENDSLGSVFEPEPAPVSGQPLDPDAIAEIVRRVVERTQPGRQLTFEEVIEEMREILRDMDRDDVAGILTKDYVIDIAEKRREARVRPSLPAMRPRQSLPAIPPRREERRARGRGRAVDPGLDHGADWGFLPDQPEGLESDPRGARGNRRESFQATVARVLRDWRHGEIRL